jgi:iron-sulfur cluster repair protein YtfE (RIC family)
MAETSISSALSAEHHRLEVLWKDACAASKHHDVRHAAFKSFADELRMHIRDEEEVLFPAFEERTGMGAHGGPTAVMRMEHRQLETLLADLIRESGGNAENQSTTDGLSRLLENHDAKEEGMLYPLMDRAFKPEDKTALLARLDALRQAVQVDRA